MLERKTGYSTARASNPASLLLLQTRVRASERPRKGSGRLQSSPILTALRSAGTVGCKLSMAARPAKQARALAFVRARPLTHAQT